MLSVKEVCAIFRELFIAVGVLLATSVPSFESSAMSKIEVPAYAKWSRLAIKQTMKKYPQADITDYLHIASQEGEKVSVEKFRLWLKEGSREFGVVVTVTFSAETGQLIGVEYQEV